MRPAHPGWEVVGVSALGLAVGMLVARYTRARVLGVPSKGDTPVLDAGAHFPHADFTRVVAPIVDDDGQVDYATLRAHRKALQHYILLVHAFSPWNTPQHFPATADRLAYWVNTYNALVLLAVVDACPVSSMLLVPPLGRVFAALRFPVGGKLMSLHDVEREAMRAAAYDPRLHFALACGARGGPALRPEAYQPDLLDEQLETQTRAFLRVARHVDIDFPRRTFILSPLFRWYRADFLGWVSAFRPGQPADVITYLLPYLPRLASDLVAEGSYRVRYRSFDWRLNGGSRQFSA